jgi:hypothetical protein
LAGSVALLLVLAKALLAGSLARRLVRALPALGLLMRLPVQVSQVPVPVPVVLGWARRKSQGLRESRPVWLAGLAAQRLAEASSVP